MKRIRKAVSEENSRIKEDGTKNRNVLYVLVSPYPQQATLSGVGWETRNFPLVRRKLSLHVHSVVVNDSGWGVDHIWSFVKQNILHFAVSSLREQVWLVW